MLIKCSALVFIFLIRQVLFMVKFEGSALKAEKKWKIINSIALSAHFTYRLYFQEYSCMRGSLH